MLINVLNSLDENLKEDIENIIENVEITNTIMKDINIKTNIAKIVLNTSDL